MPPLEILRSRWQESVNQLNALNERAVNEDRELTEAEVANAESLQRSIDGYQARIQSMASLQSSVTETDELFRNLPVVHQQGAQVTRVEQSPLEHYETLVRSNWQTPGDYMADVINAHNGDQKARDRIETINRVLANEVTGDVPGIVPTPITGEVVSIIDAARPVVSSLRSYPMPQYGSSFTRPKISTNTTVGEQVTQKTELPSSKFGVTPLTVNKQTLGGALDVAFQVIDWTNPSALNAITSDLADQYAIQTESVTCALVGAAATATGTPIELGGTAGAATSAQWITALTAAAAAVYTGAKRMPDVIYASTDRWALLAGLTDTTGRPVTQAGSPTNSVGGMTLSNMQSSILGLPLVVSPSFPANTLIVGARQFAEVYEDRKGALRVVEPRLLGWEIAYYGYFAGLVTHNAAFKRIVDLV